MTIPYQDPKAKLEAAKRRLAALDKERAILFQLIGKLEETAQRVSEAPADSYKTQVGEKSSCPVTNASSQMDKIALFRSLFRGRDDVYAVRFESSRTGKSGYRGQTVFRHSSARCYDASDLIAARSYNIRAVIQHVACRKNLSPVFDCDGGFRAC